MTENYWNLLGAVGGVSGACGTNGVDVDDGILSDAWVHPSACPAWGSIEVGVHIIQKTDRAVAPNFRQSYIVRHCPLDAMLPVPGHTMGNMWAIWNACLPAVKQTSTNKHVVIQCRSLSEPKNVIRRPPNRTVAPRHAAGLGCSS